MNTISRLAHRYIQALNAKSMVQDALRGLQSGDEGPFRRLYHEVQTILDETDLPFGSPTLGYNASLDSLPWLGAMKASEVPKVIGGIEVVKDLGFAISRGKLTPRDIDRLERMAGMVEKMLKAGMRGDANAPATDFKHGPFHITVMPGVQKADVEASLEYLDAAIRLIKPRFPRILYGQVFVSSQIPMAKKVVAYYDFRTDHVYLKAKTLKSAFTLQVLLHELGHRYQNKVGYDEGKFGALSRGWVDGVQGDPIEVTPYGGRSPVENFAEGFAFYLMGKPLHPAMQAFYEALI